MDVKEVMGWVAALLTLLAFSQQSMLPLRLAAIGANVCFATYGLMSGLMPIVALHLALLPCNLFRLAQLLCLMKERRAARTVTAPGRGAAANVSEALAATRRHSQALLCRTESGPARDAAHALAACVARLETALRSSTGVGAVSPGQGPARPLRQPRAGPARAAAPPRADGHAGAGPAPSGPLRLLRRAQRRRD
jgi:hypothetical protein